MKTLTELFERAEGFETEVIDGIYYRFRLNEDGDRYRTDEFDYQNSRAEWLEKGVEKQYAIRDKLIRNLMKDNEELKKEIQHVKDVWIGISDAKDLIIKRLEKEIVELKKQKSKLVISCSCDDGVIVCPGCNGEQSKHGICAGCKGTGIITCGKCGGKNKRLIN